MTEITCPLCGKPNPPDRDVCQFCEAPLKASGFIASPDDQDIFTQIPTPSSQPDESTEPGDQPESTSSLEQAIPDWLKQTEASFLQPSEPESEEPAPDHISEEIDSLLNLVPTPSDEQKPAIDDEWLASLLAEAGVGELAQETLAAEPLQEAMEAEETGEPGLTSEELSEEEGLLPPAELEKPEWLSDMEASSTIKLEGGMQPSESLHIEAPAEEKAEKKGAEQVEVPEWVGKTSFGEKPPTPKEPETPIVPAEIPGWLEALRPSKEEKVSPSKPVEDISAADIVTAGPLVGLRGVISAHPSAIQARKPPTYSIKLRVTEEQHARVQMMEELLAEEQKPKPLPSKPILTYRHIIRLVVAVLLILPIVWMVVSRSQQGPSPQPSNVPGVVEFAQQVQALPAGAPVLIAFDYEPGFSGEMNPAISTVLTQLASKNAYLSLVTTTPSGPALAESLMKNVSAGALAASSAYSNYTDLGFIPGGTMGLLGLAASPRTVLPYSLDGKDVWASEPLNTISSIADFSAVIVITNDPDTARVWIEQVGPHLQTQDRPLLFITSTQAEPLIRPYYQAAPSQVQGMVAGLAGGLAYGGTVGSPGQNGLWEALSISITVSILIILIGSIVSVVFLTLASNKKKEDEERP